MFRFNARLVRVVDGDTIDADIELGFSVFMRDRIRLMGIDTPESRTRNLAEKSWGLAAKHRLIELLEDCLLYTSPSPRDATLSRMPSSA